MSSQPLDEDGFHSIAWDDAPPRQAFTDVSSGFDDEDEDGFDTISATSPPPAESVASTSTAKDEHRLKGAKREGEGEMSPEEWGGRWMGIEVRDPVKEHEGSKDMFVSYAVKTKVCQWV
jgi:sorting nexin-4